MKIKDTRPFAQKHPKWNTFFGFMLLIALMAGGYFLLRFLGRKLIDFINLLITASSKLDAVIIVALITAAVTIISGVVSKIIDFKQKRREYLSQKKEEPYAEFINVYFKMQEKVSKNEIYLPDEMFNDIQKFQKKLMLWGSNRVVKAWIEYRANAGTDGMNALFYHGKNTICYKKGYGI